ncbi:GT2 family glycosyltransferase/glycosyltransferase involved in cell wall biosynthesis [Silvimonas terrae]|uniref:GT2 family glycosyltransferase/glycosyltransferase involved in cell wall biosynthesis n=1 Tax=Silvimonas terrae TaxID=300266 RepID=A0A840RIN8_9NEIS|nr:glycosyltransferase [Silvimonas terrae]MBB5192454.1 GT2 family glycosyltransferase/glycosyltransferase involved in cell wall biosynthesis [Silvimonas terrae]
MNNSVINSADYWDTRFAEDWDAHGGTEQSRYFADLAVKQLPPWLKVAQRLENMSVCDWGCAQGDGTDVLARVFDPERLVGVDFSETAIAQAKARYPQVGFKTEDWTVSGATEPEYDIVFSSNTLEHFHHPFETLDVVAQHARKLLVLILPYRELNRIDEHYFTFAPDNLPATLTGNWVPLFCKVIDCKHNSPCYWPGEQVFLIYGRQEWVLQAKLTMGDLRIDADVEMDLARGELNRRVDILQAQLEHHVAEWDAVESACNELEIRRAEEALQVLQTRVTAESHLLEEARQELEARLADEAKLIEDARQLLEARMVEKAYQAEKKRLTEKARLAEEAHQIEKYNLIEAARQAEGVHQNERARLTEEVRQVGGKLSDKTAEVAQLNKVIEQLREQYRDREQQFLLSTSWRITRPLRVIARSASRDGMASLVRQTYAVLPPNTRQQLVKLPFVRRVKSWVAKSAAAPLPTGMIGVDQTRLPANLPVLPAPTQPDVIVWGVIDWHFRIQRPQQLARGFARAGHRVFYISSELIDTPAPGFAVERIEGEEGVVFQLRLNVAGGAPIYGALPGQAAAAQLRASTAILKRWLNLNSTISVVQHPYWSSTAFALPDNQVVYDCMDHHEGFGTTADEMIRAEHQLMDLADLVVVTSDWLYDVVKPRNANVHIVRNACEFEHFNTPPATRWLDPAGRKVIGYYGAIAEWFDLDLVRAVANAYPQHSVLLIGGDTTGAAAALRDLPNVTFTGEVRYGDLPHYLYGIDVCLLPFRVIDLTLATNPVKVYEYLCPGKPVVSVDLPEMKQFGDMVYTATGHGAFIEACGKALAENDAALVQRRIEFASRQTWVHRAHEFQAALLASTKPRMSVIVVTYNNLDLTQKCLASVEKYTTGVELELIIIDNASADGSPQWLGDYASTRSFVKLQLNEDNRGFSAANNQGLAMATGEYLVILNNDTVVTPGWATGFIRHLRTDKSVGLIGPVTNNIGNEARIPVSYPSLEEMPAAAAQYTVHHMGELFDIYTLAFFCVVLPRRVYEQIGGLDEAFGIGFFEDDDYCRRVQQLGLRCVCAEDVFVHHNLSASFNKMAQEKRQALMDKNRKIYEAKWGKWSPHCYR